MVTHKYGFRTEDPYFLTIFTMHSVFFIKIKKCLNIAFVTALTAVGHVI
jgi:hypothetical protein